jgi:hypothetical protein
VEIVAEKSLKLYEIQQNPESQPSIGSVVALLVVFLDLF